MVKILSMNLRLFISPFILALSIALFTWCYVVPTHIGWILLALAFIYALAAQGLDTDGNDWWRFAVTPFLLGASTLIYCLLVPQGVSTILLLAVVVALEFLYWQYALAYTSHIRSYIPFSLERLCFALNFLTVFFLAAGAYGLKTFLDVPSWLIGIVFCCLIFVILWQWLWNSRLALAQGWRAALIVSLVTLEIFLVAGFFPLDFRILGFLVVTVYYSAVSLISQQQGGNADTRRFQILAGLIIITWLAVFLTARWL